MKSQEGYYHISHSDMNEIIELSDRLSNGLYDKILSKYYPEFADRVSHADKLDLHFDCALAENKYFFIREMNSLASRTRKLYGFDYKEADDTKMNNNLLQSFHHIHLNDLNDLVVLVEQLNLNKIMKMPINSYNLKLAKNYIEFKKIEELLNSNKE